MVASSGLESIEVTQIVHRTVSIHAADPVDDNEDLARASTALLKAVGIPPGEFIRSDG
jgi:hypothetical protein